MSTTFRTIDTPIFRRPKKMSEEDLCKALHNEPWIPLGLSEEECIRIMYETARQTAPQYCFGYHGKDDMIELAVLKIIIEMKQGKFKPRGLKPLDVQFRNWLRVWIKNRLSNYLRDKSFRYSNPDSPLNRVKYNLMHPLKIHSYGLTQSEIFARSNNEEEKIAQDEVIQYVSERLLPEERKLLVKYLNGVDLTPEQTRDLANAVKGHLHPYEET